MTKMIRMLSLSAFLLVPIVPAAAAIDGFFASGSIGAMFNFMESDIEFDSLEFGNNAHKDDVKSSFKQTAGMSFRIDGGYMMDVHSVGLFYDYSRGLSKVTGDAIIISTATDIESLDDGPVVAIGEDVYGSTHSIGAFYNYNHSINPDFVLLGGIDLGLAIRRLTTGDEIKENMAGAIWENGDPIISRSLEPDETHTGYAFMVGLNIGADYRLQDNLYVGATYKLQYLGAVDLDTIDGLTLEESGDLEYGSELPSKLSVHLKYFF